MRERRGTVGGAANHASLRVPGSNCVPIGLRRDEGGAGATTMFGLVVRCETGTGEPTIPARDMRNAMFRADWCSGGAKRASVDASSPMLR